MLALLGVEEPERATREPLMSIYWMRTAEVYQDGGYDPTDFMAFDPEVQFPHVHPTERDETIGNVHHVTGGPHSGQWAWSMTVSLPGPCYGSPTSGIEASRRGAGRRVSEVYRHYLSTRPEQYWR